MDYKEAICEALWNESEQLFRDKEIRRGIALRKSRKILQGLDSIKSIKDAEGLSGVGKGTLTRIECVIEGTSIWTKMCAKKVELTVDYLLLETTKKALATIVAKASIISLLLAESWNKLDIDPTGWWMSEKLDGIRCYWDGRGFYTRNDNRIEAPDWVVSQMPKGKQLSLIHI